MEIYVRPFPDVTAGQWLVSRDGGTEPAWARDGRELVYRASDSAVMRVLVTPGSTWTVGTPTRLFEAASYVLGANTGLGASVSRTYDVSHDGRRFLISVPTGWRG